MADRARFGVGDLARAVVELGLARLKLKRHRPQADAVSRPVATLDIGQSALVERVAYVIPRVAARLPWRADCLIQAMAAERWLASAGVPTVLIFGVPINKPATFEAHAWLKAGDTIVTGGDVSGYVPLVKP